MSGQPVWTVRGVLDWTRDFFTAKGIESARLDTEVLLAHVLSCRRIDLYADHDRPLTTGEREVLRELIKRRVAEEPVAYLTGSKEFWSLDFEVDSRVLVPRPDTEVLVEECLAPFRELGAEGSSVKRAADIATGSGVVAVVLARELPGEPEVWAVDLDADAVAVAEGNVARHGLAERVHVLQGDLVSPLSESGPFDIIAANLPYIPTADLDELPATVRDFEPWRALDGGDDGLDIVRRLVVEALPLLSPGGWLVLELSDGPQIDEAARFAGSKGYEVVNKRDDYSGLPRVLRLRKPGTSS